MYFVSYASISILLYFILLIAVGVYAMKRSTSNNQEYLLGGRNVSPKVTALSAGASDMSGWMLLGLPGAAFATGYQSIWLAIGLLLGAYINYLVVAPKLRVYTEIADNSLTIPEFLAKRFGNTRSSIRLVSAAVIIAFFTLYTASGLVAGGKLFESAFAMPYLTGVLLTVSIVVIYTILGGFLAVSLSDFIQGVIMLMALVSVPIATCNTLSTTELDAVAQLPSFDVSAVSLVGAMSLLTWGLGYFGQPHIIVRFMAIDTFKNLPSARRIGLSWMTLAIAGAFATGLIGAAYSSANNSVITDPETVFIHLSQTLFHPLIGGWFLAAILAAVMSTISSQLLVTSSSLVEDIYKLMAKGSQSEQKSLLVSRLCVLLVAAVACLIAYRSDSSVLSLVSNAWAGFGAAFGPVILLSLWWPRLTEQGALAGIIAGAGTVLFWSKVPVINGVPLSSVFYELLPAFATSCLTIVVVSLRTQPSDSRSQRWFQTTDAIIKNAN